MEQRIKLLNDKGFIPTDLQDKLLDNVQNGKSNLETLRELYGNSLAGNEETLSGPEGDTSDLIEEKAH